VHRDAELALDLDTPEDYRDWDRRRPNGPSLEGRR
jgi:hypothetical protein